MYNAVTSPPTAFWVPLQQAGGATQDPARAPSNNNTAAAPPQFGAQRGARGDAATGGRTEAMKRMGDERHDRWGSTMKRLSPTRYDTSMFNDMAMTTPQFYDYYGARRPRRYVHDVEVDEVQVRGSWSCPPAVNGLEQGRSDGGGFRSRLDDAGGPMTTQRRPWRFDDNGGASRSRVEPMFGADRPGLQPIAERRDGDQVRQPSDDEPRRRLPRAPRQVMAPEKFSGQGNVHTFFAQFENCAAFNFWDDDEKAAYLRWSLTGPAAQLLWDLGSTVTLSYNELADRILRRYGSAGQEEKYQAELRALRRRRGESLQELQQTVRRLMVLAYPGEVSRFSESLAKDAFLAALDDRDLELKVREREPPDLDAAFKVALRLETYERTFDANSGRDNAKGKQARQARGEQETPTIRDLQVQMQQMLDGQKRVNDTIDQLRRDNSSLSKELGRIQLLQGSNRGAPGAAAGAEGSGGARSEPATERRGGARSDIRCYNCDELGHISSRCPHTCR